MTDMSRWHRLRGLETAWIHSHWHCFVIECCPKTISAQKLDGGKVEDWSYLSTSFSSLYALYCLQNLSDQKLVEMHSFSFSMLSWVWDQWRIQRGFHGFCGTPLLKGCLRKYYAQTYYVATLRSHWSYALQLHSSNNARVSPHSCIMNSTRAWPTCTYNERSEQVN